MLVFGGVQRWVMVPEQIKGEMHSWWCSQGSPISFCWYFLHIGTGDPKVMHFEPPGQMMWKFFPIGGSFPGRSEWKSLQISPIFFCGLQVLVSWEQYNPFSHSTKFVLSHPSPISFPVQVPD